MVAHVLCLHAWILVYGDWSDAYALKTQDPTCFAPLRLIRVISLCRHDADALVVVLVSSAYAACLASADLDLVFMQQSLHLCEPARICTFIMLGPALSSD